MLKFGICTVRELKDDVDKGPRRRPKQVAISLLDEISDEADCNRLRERVLLELSDDRGAYKRTYKDRFVEFDMSVCNEARKAFAVGTHLKVIDCGISDGITAVDFFSRLSRDFPDIEFLGTDYDPYVKTLTRGNVTVVFSSNNAPIQLIRPPFVFNLSTKDWWVKYPINRLILSRLSRTHIPSMLQQLSSPGAGARISLYCRAATSLAKKDRRFRLDRHDILKPFSGRYHIIRMMNLLNPQYFSASQFERIVENIHRGLLPGGLLAVGSNAEAGTSVFGGIYRAAESGMTELVDAGLAPHLRKILVASKR
jgi:hypothetical protein